jgi:hypothetical protein
VSSTKKATRAFQSYSISTRVETPGRVLRCLEKCAYCPSKRAVASTAPMSGACDGDDVSIGTTADGDPRGGGELPQTELDGVGGQQTPEEGDGILDEPPKIPRQPSLRLAKPGRHAHVTRPAN